MKMNLMHRLDIEPGLLYLFRLASMLGLIVAVLSFLNMLEETDHAWYFLLLFLINDAFMVTFLHIAWFQHQSGRWFLPLALFIGVIGPFVETWFQILWDNLNNIPQNITIESIGSVLLLSLFLPLFIMSAQYGFRLASGFSITVAAGHFLLGYLLLPNNAPLFRHVIDASLSIGILFPFIAFVVAKLVSEQRQARMILDAKNRQLAQYASIVERLAVSNERTRIARELHDTLSHTLSALSIQLSAIEKQIDHDLPGTKQMLKVAQSAIRDGLSETRQALKELRVSPLAEFGLLTALKKLADKLKQQHSFDIDCQFVGMLDELSPEVEQSLYRIAEEALYNVARHARADAAYIHITQQNGTISLQIGDNGIGFDTARSIPTGHYGLIGMQERSILCNGQLQIESKPGTGTVVTLEIKE